MGAYSGDLVAVDPIKPVGVAVWGSGNYLEMTEAQFARLRIDAHEAEHAIISIELSQRTLVPLYLCSSWRLSISILSQK